MYQSLNNSLLKPMKHYQYYLLLLLILLSGSTLAQSPKKVRWNFNNMDGWEYAHQDDNPQQQCSIEKGKLRIFTRAESVDRKKLRTTDKIYTTGRYTWRTYISAMGVGDQSSIGSWIYCDDHHEIDFEVGYGKKEVREKLQAKPDEMIAYMTTQDHPFQSVPVKVKVGWHLFEIDITSVDGKYKVDWLIDRKTESSVQQTYGDGIAFHIFCSVENLKFLGDTPASQDNYGLYDYVKYKYHP